MLGHRLRKPKISMIENGAPYSRINYLGELHLEPAYSLAAVNLSKILAVLEMVSGASVCTFRLNVQILFSN